MKKIIIFVFLMNFLHAANDECATYFAAKKHEMDKKILEFDEAKQALESYKAAFLALQKEHESTNQNLLDDIQKEREQIDEIRNQNAKILAKIRQIKDEITQKKQSKIAQSYAKMKDAAAAAIFEQMPSDEVVSIMLQLEPKKISAILSKMQPESASKITKLLRNKEF